MQTPIEPYLALLRQELATTLMPRDDDNAKRVATFSHLFLTQILLHSSKLPALQRQALNELDKLLDELNTLLRSITSGMVLSGELTQHVRTSPDFERAEPALQRAAILLLSNPGESSKVMLRKISTILLNLQEAFHQAVLEQKIEPDAAQSHAQPALDEAQIQALQAYMRRRFEGETKLVIGPIKAIIGGGSKKTLLVDLHHTHKLPETIVVRADQAGGAVESTVCDEYRLIEILYQAGLPVPQPYALEADTSILGAAFIVVSMIEGRNIGDNLDIHEPSKSFGRGLARAMGRMHRIPAEQFGDNVAGANTNTLERVRQDMSNFEAVWRNSGEASVALELSYAWLKDHMAFAEGRRALIHCDIGCHNMLAKDGELTALLDWETSIIGNPAHDLAYVYPLVVQMMSWDDFLEQYEKAGGTAPSVAEFDFYRLWTASWRMSFVFIARSFFHSGASSSVVFAYAAQHIYQRCEYDLNRVLNDIYGRY